MVDQETYLRTQQLADALGVSISSIKRWVDKGVIKATRTTGKHRLVSLSSALQFARDEKYPTGNLLAMSVGPVIDTIDDRLVEALLEALKSGNSRQASSIVASAFQSHRDAVALADQLIRPVMERVGQLWLLGALDIYQEHQATQTLVSSLLDLIRKLSQDDSAGKPLALGASPEGDVYTLPVLLGELVLRQGGWDVKNLGSHLPLRSMAKAIREYRPKLVFLSASLIIDRARFLHEYSYFYESATQVGAAIILGGRALDPDLRSKLVYASFGDRMAHLAEFARQLHPTRAGKLGDDPNQSQSMDIST